MFKYTVQLFFGAFICLQTAAQSMDMNDQLQSTINKIAGAKKENFTSWANALKRDSLTILLVNKNDGHENLSQRESKNKNYYLFRCSFEIPLAKKNLQPTI